MKTFKEFNDKTEITEAKANHPKGTFLVVNEGLHMIVDGSYFTPNPEENDFTEEMVRDIEKVKPLSTIKVKGESEYLPKTHSYEDYLFRLK